MTPRKWLSYKLYEAAVRLNPRLDYRAMSGWSFTFENHRGLVWNQDRRGCPAWFVEGDYERAHQEAEAPAKYRFLPGPEGHAVIGIRTDADPAKESQR